MSAPLIDPAVIARIAAAGAEMVRAMSASVRVSMDRFNAAVEADRQRRRDLDDEYDWLGEWGGRRG